MKSSINTQLVLTMIILTNQDGRQFPQGCHIQRLKKLTLVSRSIPIHCKRDCIFLVIFLRKCQTTTQRYLSSHNPMPTIKAAVLLVEMHGSTFALGTTTTSSHQLREGLDHGPPSAEIDTVVSISSNNAVLFSYSSLHPDRHSFLAVVKMAKSADELGLVERISCKLHPTHGSHVTEEGENLGRSCGYRSRRRVDHVARKGDACFDGEGCGSIGDVGGEG